LANILVHIELKENEASVASLAALTAGRTVATRLGATLYALLPCASPPSYGTDDIITVLSRHGADKVILVAHPSLNAPPLYATHGKAVLAACEQFRPRLLLFAASAAGQDIAPRVAATIGAELAANVRLTCDDGGVTLTGTVFRRRYLLTVAPRLAAAPLVATLVRGDPPRPIGDEEAEVIVTHGSMPDTPGLEIRGCRGAPRSDPATARIVVGGGGGVCGKEGFALVRRLAALLGGAPAGSETACSANVAETELQVGLGGSCLPSKTYLAFGVSGSDRHLAGLAPDTAVVAVNTDAGAPLFATAEHGMVADATQVLRDLIAELDGGGAA
jgi:electron transfer flavoprotein alpha subunit